MTHYFGKVGYNLRIFTLIDKWMKRYEIVTFLSNDRESNTNISRGSLLRRNYEESENRIKWGGENYSYNPNKEDRQKSYNAA